MEDRLTELESRIAFQDDTLRELNDIVARQQQQIQVLEQGMRLLSEQLKAVAPSLVADAAEETPPPHY